MVANYIQTNVSMNCLQKVSMSCLQLCRWIVSKNRVDELSCRIVSISMSVVWNELRYWDIRSWMYFLLCFSVHVTALLPWMSSANCMLGIYGFRPCFSQTSVMIFSRKILKRSTFPNQNCYPVPFSPMIVKFICPAPCSQWHGLDWHWYWPRSKCPFLYYIVLTVLFKILP